LWDSEEEVELEANDDDKDPTTENAMLESEASAGPAYTMKMVLLLGNVGNGREGEMVVCRGKDEQQRRKGLGANRPNKIRQALTVREISRVLSRWMGK